MKLETNFTLLQFQSPQQKVKHFKIAAKKQRVPDEDEFYWEEESEEEQDSDYEVAKRSAFILPGIRMLMT